MPDRFNKLKNADFSEGVSKPRGWNWSAQSEDVRWTFAPADDGDGRNVVIQSVDADCCGFFEQRVRCKPEHWYRVEAVVTAECAAASAEGGVYLLAVPEATERDRELTLARVSRTTGPMTLRAFLRTDEDTRSMDLRIGMAGANGTATVHSALVIPMIEPDIKSHAVALPPPPYAYPPPRRVRKVAVCDSDGRARPLVSLLAARFGKGNVDHRRCSEVRLDDVNADALIIPDNRLPPGLRSVTALERAAKDRLIVVSLQAFAKIAARGLTVRTVEQPDDPMHAKISWANFITRGFALHDQFSWASTTADDAQVFQQQHLKRGASLNALCREHEFETVLLSETDSESTSDHPMCLYKEVEGGGIVVMDTAPIETRPTSFDEPNLAAFVLLNALGADQAALGQYAVPEDTEREFCELINEFGRRYPAVRVSGRDRFEKIVEVGAEEETLGLPARRRPVILVRTGLTGDDMGGVYGALLYFKQLARTQPHENAYARELVSRFRLAWAPLGAPWRGWHAVFGARVEESVGGEFERGEIASVIDVTHSSDAGFRVLHEKRDALFERQSELLPSLAKRFSHGRYFYRGVGVDAEPGRDDLATWRKESITPRVEVDARPFESPLHRSAASAGAKLIRIETPGCAANFICNSIWRTDCAAVTLEHVIGSLYGVLAVNRGSGRVAFGDHTPLAPGEAINVPLRPKDKLQNRRVG